MPKVAAVATADTLTMKVEYEAIVFIVISRHVEIQVPAHTTLDDDEFSVWQGIHDDIDRVFPGARYRVKDLC